MSSRDRLWVAMVLAVTVDARSRGAGRRWPPRTGDHPSAGAEHRHRDPVRPGLEFLPGDAEADGFLLKRATPEQLIDGIRTVFAGDALVAPAVTRRVMHAYAGRRPADWEQLQLAAHLTEWEADILRALAEGLSNAEVAAQFWLSQETVKTHVKSILGKLGVRDRTQAVVWAYRPGFIGTPPMTPRSRSR